jgi:hypothetical protein
LFAWAGEGTVPLQAKSFDENAAALLIGRMRSGASLYPPDPPEPWLASCLAGDFQRLERAINALRQHWIAFPDALLPNVSPIGWEHINLTGA